MPVQKLLTRKLLLFFKYLLVFKRPRFAELDFVDLVIEDKPLILVFWKIKNGYKLRIKPLRKRYSQESGSMIIELPKLLPYVDLKASNFWSSYKVRVHLKHTRLDAEAASYLLQKISLVQRKGETLWSTPLSATEVLNTDFSVLKSTPKVQHNITSVPPIKLLVTKKLVLNTQHLNYP